ncbi:hypothetical protein EDB89DRAFT_1939432 [Lactarius sanguifluus]|nr:hypothetical protein EDB89DRAFT_1939432 [Lactarius sanguifluus]
MLEPTLKRKRSLLQDSTVGPSRMRTALNCLEALKKELDGIEETEEALHIALEHVHKVEDILKDVKKPVSFLTVSSKHLKKVGVKRKPLIFADEKITELTNGLTMDAEAQIADLHSRLKEIYACVNMGYESSSRMIIDAVLLALRKITSTQHTDVAILPGMRVTNGDGVQISHPTSGYELWLSDNIDYVVIEYENDNKNCLFDPGRPRDDVFKIANGRLFLLVVEVNHQSCSEERLTSCVPEAVGQAIALLKIANLPEVRFCLSDGQTWTFFILKSENNTLIYYESAIYRLSRDIVENTNLPLREIVQLVREWLKPTATDLFSLE